MLTRRHFLQTTAAALVVLLATGTRRVSAQSSPDRSARPQIRVLGIGNSFTEDAFALLRPIARRCDKVELLIGQATIGGCSMEKHMRLAKLHEQDPHHQDGLTFGKVETHAEGKRVRVKIGLKEVLLSERWDIVSIQQLSRESTDIASYRPYARELVAYIKKYAPQAEVVLHQTWAYRVDGDFDQVFPNKPGYDQQAMHRDLTEAYATIAQELGLRLVPVGTAFQQARESRPFVPDETIRLSDLSPPHLPPQENSLCAGWSWDLVAKPPKIGFDSHHAGVRGKFLAAAVWFEFLTGLNICTEGLVAGELPAADVQFLSQIAHETLQHQAAGVPAGIAQ